MTDLLPFCEEVARLGGAVLMDWRPRIQAREKGPNDLVTEADLESQRVIRAAIAARYPHHDFLGEESDPSAPSTTGAEYRWIVDPLDGTANYVHGLPNFAVSVGVERGGRLIAGVVYDPTTGECFAAEEGRPATLDGKPIRPSDCRTAGAALVAASFSPKVPRGSKEVGRFLEALHTCQGVRRFGSAALNLCYVACGRLDAYWATSVKIWDVAAGVVVLKQAGAVVEGVRGGAIDPERPEILASSTRSLQSEMLRLFAPVESDQAG